VSHPEDTSDDDSVDSEQFRWLVYRRDEFTCRICGHDKPEADLDIAYILPPCDGGSRRDGNLITLCRACDEAGYRDRVYELLGRAPDYLLTFATAIDQVEALARSEVDDYALRGLFRQMLFVAAITAVETYLYDTIIGVVTRSPTLVRRVVETSPGFKNRRCDLSDIYRRIHKMAEEVRTYLSGLMYHNLPQVRELYHHVLGVALPKTLRELIAAVSRRHDLVHRGGKTKDGMVVYVTTSDVFELCEALRVFVAHIDSQIRERSPDVPYVYAEDSEQQPS
jgi:hypothetical protein